MKNICVKNTLKLSQQFRRCHLKIFSFLSSGGHFVWWSPTISAVLVDGLMKNI